ncbi:MAG: zinc dependent phospholipase C family protein [Proteobacteria bacterium]|nr:zinc dependent phospholipase C family protein [Pseudomonadota bacterium]MCP4920298.1 zinc dependent phospholipase C family protein [Pseudomonadota bacterium]
MPLLLWISLTTPDANAHGIWGHVHVTGWAVENMPDDELRQFLLEPEVFNALLFGAVFTDTGYAIDDPAARAYSEHTHWEPFIEDYIEWMRVNDPPPWTTLESKKRVAFLMGCASHGMQDSIFDSLFLHQVELRDGAGQSETDPGTDGFLVLDDHIRFIPTEDIPFETVLELYEGLSADVTREVIDEAVGLTTDVYINDDIGLTIAAGLGEQHADAMPWGREHYMDPEVPGSLRAEIFPTMRYQQAIWARLHDELDADDVTVFAFPEEPRRLRSGDPETVDSWVTLIFGAGVTYEGELVELLDDDGQVVPFTQANTRWGAGHTRLVRLLPDEPLTAGGWYTARLAPGAELIDGRTTTEPYELTFQVACDDDDPACPDLGDIPVAHVDGIPDEPVEEPDRCGCSAGATPLGIGALLAALLARRRTRGRVSNS